MNSTVMDMTLSLLLAVVGEIESAVEEIEQELLSALGRYSIR